MWTLWVLIIGSFLCKYTDAQGQRIAPGVPPQHYQQPVQQVHQVPPQIQQIPQQQQAPVQPQVPVQQVPAQQQHIPVQQQVPIQQTHGGIHEHGQQVHGGHHEHGQHPQQLLHNTNIAGEQDHMSEHLEVPIDTKKMTDQELQFYYFKMHDEDNNNKLDGCELSKSLIHWHEQGNKDPSVTNPIHKLFPDDELSALIDPILSMDDTNNDGYIDYPEFVQAQQNAAATGRP